MEKEKMKKKLSLEISIAKDVLEFIESQISKGEYIGETETILTAHRKNYQRLLKEKAIIDTSNEQELKQQLFFFEGICEDLKANGLDQIQTNDSDNPFEILRQIKKKLDVFEKWK